MKTAIESSSSYSPRGVLLNSPAKVSYRIASIFDIDDITTDDADADNDTDNDFPTNSYLVKYNPLVHNSDNSENEDDDDDTTDAESFITIKENIVDTLSNCDDDDDDEDFLSDMDSWNDSISACATDNEDSCDRISICSEDSDDRISICSEDSGDEISIRYITGSIKLMAPRRQKLCHRVVGIASKVLEKFFEQHYNTEFNKYTWCIGGGFAAYCAGATQTYTNIDVFVFPLGSKSDFPKCTLPKFRIEEFIFDFIFHDYIPHAQLLDIFCAKLTTFDMNVCRYAVCPLQTRTPNGRWDNGMCLQVYVDPQSVQDHKFFKITPKTERRIVKYRLRTKPYTRSIFYNYGPISEWNSKIVNLKSLTDQKYTNVVWTMRSQMVEIIAAKLFNSRYPRQCKLKKYLK